MFLATTALREFWDPDETLVCLGSWCLRYDQRAEWEGLPRQVLPCPWDDRERFYRAARALDECGERLLPRLAEYLNSTHGVSHAVAYWRVVIGPWLLHYLHAVYDRHAHLVDAFARHPELTTLVMDPASYRVPTDTAEMAKYLAADTYNLQLVSQLLGEMGYRFPEKPYGGPWILPENGGATKARPLLRRVARAGYHAKIRFDKWRVGDRWQVAVHDLDCSDALLQPLMRRSRRAVMLAQLPDAMEHEPPAPVWDARRLGLRDLPYDGEFERLAVRLLPHHLPTLYLEGYRAAVASAERHIPVASVIVSAAGWYFDEPFKFTAAAARQGGARLVAAQHGGGYGMFHLMPLEQHERRVSDEFLAWGWADSQPHVRNVPPPKLSSWLQKPRRSSSSILFVSTCHPRYLYRFHSAPVGSQWEAYMAWQARFFHALPARIRHSVVCRPYAHDYGHGLRARLRAAFPELQWDRGGSWPQRMLESRLVVIDHLATTLLETLALNIPTLVFLDPNRWEVRAEAAEDVEWLRRAGIWHDTPEVAAAAVMRASADPAWWLSQSVQEARQRFVERHAMARPDWASAWATALPELIGRSEPAAG